MNVLVNCSMNYRKFGKTDLNVSEVGFGAWAIGGAASVGNVPIGWGSSDDAESLRAIQAALDAGINFFDTADFYGLGHSEELLGDTLKNNKDAVIATKVGHRDINDKIVLDYSAAYIEQACEASLRRLKRESIDYYQLHSAKLHHLEQGECVEAMERLKQKGKIRYWGLSLNTFHPEVEADHMINKNIGDGFQLVFNMINQRALQTIEKASLNGYGVIARMPLQFGLLTGKFSREARFTETDHRSFRLTGEVMDKALNILERKVWPLAEKLKMSKTSLALSFILSVPGISTVIPGIRTPEHVNQNTEGIKSLEHEEMQYLLSLAQTDWKEVVQLMQELG